MKETWKQLPDFPNYMVSDIGRVKSKKKKERSREKILKPQKHVHGYNLYSLYKDGQKTMMTGNVIVAITFLGHKPDGQNAVVDHINSVKWDDRLHNLQILTHRENTTKGWFEKPTSSRYTGVTALAKGWVARIGLNGTQRHLGYFMSELEAHKAYQQALKELTSNPLIT